MIAIELDRIETFNPRTNEFEYIESETVDFEYSLKALYEWEGKWKKAFLNPNFKITNDEATDFYLKMASKPIDKRHITSRVAKKLSDYISDSNTATVFSTPTEEESNKSSSGKGKVHTSEEIYALMAMSNIPFEWEHRNLNRLLVMLKIISNKNSPSKKMSKQDVMKQNTSLNAQRKARLKTKG